MTDNKITRREFVQRTAVAGAGLIGAGILGTSPEATAQQVGPVSRVSVIRSESVMANGSSPDGQKVLEMLDAAVRHVFNADSAEQAWAQVAAADDVVAIKTNCICALLATSVPVVQAVCTRLMDLGIPAEHIIVYDRASGELRNKGGFELCKSGPGVRIYGTDGDYDDPINHRSFHHRLTNILTQKASALINMPVLKNHGGAGITLAMKNHYGTIDKPGPYHGNNCDPHIADINDIPAIKNKTRLIVADAIRGCWDGGPGPGAGTIWAYKGIIVGTDPVACDTIGTGIIDAKRQEKGRPPLGGGPGKLPKHINTAAGHGLGTNDLANISLLQRTLA